MTPPTRPSNANSSSKQELLGERRAGRSESAPCSSGVSITAPLTAQSQGRQFNCRSSNPGCHPHCWGSTHHPGLDGGSSTAAHQRNERRAQEKGGKITLSSDGWRA